MITICRSITYIIYVGEPPLKCFFNTNWHFAFTNCTNSGYNSFEFTLLNFNQILTGRQTNFITLKNNAFKVGVNCLANRLPVINNKTTLNWLNLSLDMYKVKCKKDFPQCMNYENLKCSYDKD